MYLALHYNTGNQLTFIFQEGKNTKEKYKFSAPALRQRKQIWLRDLPFTCTRMDSTAAAFVEEKLDILLIFQIDNWVSVGCRCLERRRRSEVGFTINKETCFVHKASKRDEPVL